jgi:hypothetical protein
VYGSVLNLPTAHHQAFTPRALYTEPLYLNTHNTHYYLIGNKMFYCITSLLCTDFHCFFFSEEYNDTASKIKLNLSIKRVSRLYTEAI